MDNRRIADRLDAFASLLELADANPYMARAYRRAAETIRATPAPVAELVRDGRVRELRGIGPGIEARLRELVETGAIEELAELERELAPGLVGLGRYLGLSAKRSVEIARALGVRTPDELREAAAAGRLRTVRGIGPKTEARLLEALAREAEPRPQRALLLNRAWELVGAIAAALDGEAAGDVRRWRDACEQLAVVCAAEHPSSLLERFAALPQIVAVVEQADRRAVGVTVDGVPVELVVAAPGLRDRPRARDRLARLRRGARAAARGARRGRRLPGARPAVVPAGAARGAVPRRAAGPRRRGRDPRRSALPHDVVGRSRERRGDGLRRPRARLRVRRDLRPHARRRGRRGLTADDVRRQAEEIAAANELLAPFRVLRGIECDILPDGRLDLPDDVLADLDWVQASVHGGQRMPRREMTKRVEEALRNPYVSCLSHPKGRLINRRPENALDLERVYEVARETGVALEVNGLPPASTCAASTSARRCAPACRSSARPTPTRPGVSGACRSRSTRRAAAGRRPRTS